MIEIDGLTVRFGGVVPLDQMSVTFGAGTCGLIGPNGAGKTTFFNVLSGFVRPIAGVVHAFGDDLLSMKDFRRARWGLRRTFQTEQAIANLPVYDNVLLILEHTGGDRSARRRDVNEAIDFVGLSAVANREVGTLGAAQRRLVEVARAVVGKPRLVLLDEPGAGLPDEETLRLGDVIRRIPDAVGAQVILVDHDMSLVSGCCETTAVLDFGRLIASGRDEGRTPERARDPGLPRHRGRAVTAVVETDRSRTLTVQDLCVPRGGREVLHGVSLEIVPGEVTALLGPNGAGKSTMVLAIAGALKCTSGTVRLGDEDLTKRRPEKIRQAGVAVVPEGRRLLPELTVADNLRVATYALDAEGAEKGTQYALELFPELKDRWEAVGRSLSGGQQQMVVLAQALVSRPKVLLVDELSLGLAPLVVKRLVPTIAEVAASGVAVLLIEQFAHVALGLANVAYVLEGGRIRYRGTARELKENPETLHSAYLLRT